MALLKVFADGSGDPADPQPSMMSIAGYVAKPEEWGLFEFEWDATLKMHRVPYLHMKEWWNRDGIYKQLKEDAQKEALFFSDLVNVIEKHTEVCVSATIVLRDFERFNEPWPIPTSEKKCSTPGACYSSKRLCVGLVQHQSCQFSSA